MKPVEIFCDIVVEIICPDCGMMFDIVPKRKWNDYRCPYCKKKLMAKNILQALWLDEDEKRDT